MAIIQCKKCGHSISDRAERCIYCGCHISENKTPVPKQVLPDIQEPRLDAVPTKKHKPKHKKKPKNRARVSKKLIGIFAAVVIVILSAILIFTHTICLNHSYSEANVLEPQTCYHCGKMKGEPKPLMEIEFPTKGIGSLLPLPESNMGEILWDDSNSFNAYIGNTTQADFNEYVKKCSDVGFDIDYQKGNDFYYSEDSSGNNLDIWYYEKDIMQIQIYSEDVFDNASTNETRNGATSELQNQLPTKIEFGFIDYTDFSQYWFDGVYRCGTDFNAGEYYILPLFGAGAMYDVSDSPNDWEWSNYRSLRKISVQEGEYVNVSHGAIMVSADEVDTDNWGKYGVYLVGRDILAGEYKMETITDTYCTDLYNIEGISGAYQICDNNIENNPVDSNYLFESQKYITLENGQYIAITNIRLTNVEVIQPSTNRKPHENENTTDMTEVESDTVEESDNNLDVDDIDVADIIDDLTWYEYEERSRKKDDLFSYYDYMTDEQKRECLALYLFYQKAPNAVEKKIKNSLKNPSSYTLYSMDVSSVITYDEEKDEFTGFIDITYGGTNSFGGMEKETDSVWIDFAVDIESKDIYIRDITIWDL